jgi:hypothetical protein
MKEHPSTSIPNCITFTIPAAATAGNPLCATLDSGNSFTASGGTGNPSVTFLSVHGQIVGTPISVSGNVIDPAHWNIGNLGPITAGNTYELLVTANVMVAGSGASSLCATSTYFIAVNNSYSCPSGHSPPPAESMFARVMPRYFRVRLQEEISDVASRAGGLTFGGLLQPSSIYLAYDLDASTLATAVWRDINLPDYIGRWTLRVTQSCCGSNAELVQQTLGPNEVRTAMIFHCDRWSFWGPNVFVLTHSMCGDAGSARLTVIVEPT